MPTNTTVNQAITFDVDGTATECQTIDVSFSPSGVTPGATVEVACPGGKVSEPGSTEDGSITGNLFIDPTATGITWLLAEKFQTGEEFPVVLTFYSDLGPTHAMQWTCVCKVRSFTQPFEKPGYAKQPIDLAVISQTLARPQAA
jgi:hypothetical protein